MQKKLEEKMILSWLWESHTVNLSPIEFHFGIWPSIAIKEGGGTDVSFNLVMAHEVSKVGWTVMLSPDLKD